MLPEDDAATSRIELVVSDGSVRPRMPLSDDMIAELKSFDGRSLQLPEGYQEQAFRSR